ncbi:MAG TPA: cytochrome P450 [Ornithinibacter sp.]|nr:cytochrome P450 [Ornithinibacter sp.]
MTPDVARHVAGRLRDDTVAFRRDPYRFISRRAAEADASVFETRILLRRTHCMTGAAAAAVFSDPVRFQRAGAAPGPLQKTLFGRGGVQGLDGEQHRHRKAMFLGLTAPDRMDALRHRVREEWRAASARWVDDGEVDLYAQAQQLLTRAVCAWAGVPLREGEVATRTRQLSALFDDAATVGIGHLRARAARRGAERWAEDIVASIRAGVLQTPGEGAAAVIARHREVDGQLLTPRIAAVELLNVLRPTVATAVYTVFVVHALDEHPEWRRRIAAGNASEDLAFLEEVRRHYPFFPAVAAIVREDFEWQGHHFRRGTRALLDLYGTNHDPRVWPEPFRFAPERFLGPAPDRFAFVPQGGGDPAVHHRCPGEPISLGVMGVVLDELTRRTSCSLAGPMGPVDLTRLPALPKGGCRVSSHGCVPTPRSGRSPSGRLTEEVAEPGPVGEPGLEEPGLDPHPGATSPQLPNHDPHPVQGLGVAGPAA